MSHMNVFPMEDKVLELVARRFHVLGETFRLRILQLLNQRARNVGELVNLSYYTQLPLHELSR